MFIMTILMALITTTMVHLVNPALQTEAIRDSSDNLNIAFLDLDSEVRYASQIWAPYAGTSGDTWDVLFTSTFDGAATPNCWELQYNDGLGELLQQTWSEGATSAPGFKMLVNGLTGTADPFAIVSNTNFEEVQLSVTLSAASGTGEAYEKTSSSVTFTALNSTGNAAATGTACGGPFATTQTWTQS